MLNEKFTIAEEKERIAYLQMKKQLNLFKDCQIWLSPVGDGYVYDGTMIKLKDGSKVKSYIMEFKVRNFHLDMEIDGFFLEVKKLDSLKKIQKKWKKEMVEDYDILYFNFTEHYTVCWNLSSLEKDGKLNKENRLMNKATMNSTKDKIDKGVYLLKIEDGKKIPFKWDEIYYKQYMSPPPVGLTIKEVVRAVGIPF